MKRIFMCLFVIGFLAVSVLSVNAYVSVKGYFRSNGTYVQPYVRSSPNGLKYDNYGYKPGQELYNPSYGTKGSTWDIPTYITDPNYFEGKRLYESNSSVGSIDTSYISPTPSFNNTKVYGGSYIGTSLFCDYGYYKRNNSCIKAPENSTASNDSFSCNYGYIMSGDYCVKNIQNSSVVGSSVFCNPGYRLNSSGTACITYDSYCNEINHGLGLHYQNGQCVCETNYVWNSTEQMCVFNLICGSGYVKRNNKCLTYTDDCHLSFGENIVGEAGINNNSSCYCASGYEFNKTRTACVKTKTLLMRSLKLNHNGVDVSVLQETLKNQGYYSGLTTGVFDNSTKQAVADFQAENGLEITGSVGPKTREQINLLIK